MVRSVAEARAEWRRTDRKRGIARIFLDVEIGTTEYPEHTEKEEEVKFRPSTFSGSGGCFSKLLPSVCSGYSVVLILLAGIIAPKTDCPNPDGI
jgi:hypothetical protein